MSVTIVASGRIVASYAVDGLNHKAHAYVRNAQLVGSSWMINSRATDSNDKLWSNAAQGFMDALSVILKTANTTWGDASLETYAGGIYTVRATATITPVGANDQLVLASQSTLVLRDTSFNKVKVEVMEAGTPTPFHTTSKTGGNATVDLFVSYFTADHGNTNDPYNWMVGRGNQYLNTSPFVGWTTTYNRKLRRARGLA